MLNTYLPSDVSGFGKVSRAVFFCKSTGNKTTPDADKNRQGVVLWEFIEGDEVNYFDGGYL